THQAKARTTTRSSKATRGASGGRARAAERTKKPKGQPVFDHGFPAEPPAPSANDSQRHRESREAALAAIGAALDKKALMPALLDVSGRATYTDFIGVVSGRSDRQVDAIAENVREVMQRRGWRLLGR